jgi:hypothetical protein
VLVFFEVFGGADRAGAGVKGRRADVREFAVVGGGVGLVQAVAAFAVVFVGSGRPPDVEFEPLQVDRLGKALQAEGETGVGFADPRG